MPETSYPPSKESRDITIRVRVNEKEYHRLCDTAFNETRSYSEIVREALWKKFGWSLDKVR